jgi:hypothetical protein
LVPIEKSLFPDEKSARRSEKICPFTGWSRASFRPALKQNKEILPRAAGRRATQWSDLKKTSAAKCG